MHVCVYIVFVMLEYACVCIKMGIMFARCYIMQVCVCIVFVMLKYACVCIKMCTVFAHYVYLDQIIR